MNKIKICGIFLAITVCFLACKKDIASDWKELSLLKYGIPVSVMAPDSANVKTMDFGLQKDITVQKGQDYSIQIFASDAATLDMNKVKAQQLAMLEENPYFVRVVKDDADGFIYENKIDSTNLNYGFRYIKIQGDKEYIFQTGLIGAFSKEQVEAMYNSVKSK